MRSMKPTLGLLTLLVLLGGCARASAPVLPAGEALPMQPPTYALQEGGDSLVAMFTISIDPETLAGTVTPVRGTASQPPQGQRYDLDIANFQNADSLRVTGVQVLGSGNYRITFSHAHPFPAPDVSMPVTGVNRADLGYTGRLVFLSQYNPQAFFTNTVRISAGGVTNPDGYTEVRDLLANADPAIVTAFPYKLFADEAQNNRVDVSNGGDPEGSYAPSAGGWQRVNLGSNGTGWTGFDFVHGGQTITNQFDLSKAMLESSNFALDVALLIQYTDPRGSGGAVNRLPGAVIDVADFAYRLPYAALDCSRTTVTSNLTVGPKVGDSSPLTVRIRDWDASADEAADSTVGDESNVALVQAGASGAPNVVLDAPGVLSGLRNMGTPTGTGYSDDLLTYSNTVVNQAGAAAGQHWGCLRIDDPEVTDSGRADYHQGVDPDTLVPSKSRGIRAYTWQVVPITVGPALPVVTSVSPSGVVKPVGEFTTFSANVVGAYDSINWDFGGGAIPNTSTEAEPYVQLAYDWGTYTGTVIATNSGGDSVPFTFEFSVQRPQRPYLDVSEVHRSTNTINTAPDDSFIVFEGRPVVTYLHGNPDDPPEPTGLYVSLGRVSYPEGPADWDTYLLSESLNGVGVSIASIDGRLAIAAADPGVHNLNYVRATTINPMDAGDWAIHEIAAGEWGFQQRLIEYRGRPAILALEYVLKDAFFYRSAVAEPTSDGDWGSHLLDNNAQTFALDSLDLEGVSRLVAVVSNSTDDEVRCYLARRDEPASGANWNSRTLSVAKPNAVDIVPFDAQPALAGAGLALVVGRDGTSPRCFGLQLEDGEIPVVTSFYDLQLASPVSNGWPSVAVLNGRLIVATTENQGNIWQLVVARAMVRQPGSRDWDYISHREPYNFRPQIGVLGNRFMVFAANQGIDWGYRFYTSDGPW